MPSFTKIFTLAALVAVSSASAIAPILERAAKAGHHCPGSKLAHQATVDVGGKTVTLTSFECDHGHSKSRRGLFDSPPLCILLGTCKSSPPPPTPPTNVCGASCTTSCNNNAGVLPPTDEDCQAIKDAIVIFQGQTTTFVVDPSHLETLTFGTCNFFFSNTGTKQLEYCWADLSTTASSAASACFPPVQPFSSEGLCTATDNTWAAGAAHS